MAHNRVVTYIKITLKIIVLVFIVLCVCLSSYLKFREKRYYKDQTNYITENAVVDNVIYNDQQNYIVFWLSEIDESYQCSDFIIEGQNYFIVSEKGVKEKIKIGDEITMTSAPKYFGNGDFMPIISLSINEDVLLSYEEGYVNLLGLY